MVTCGGAVCAMVVVAILSSDGTGGRTGRAGGQHCDESGGNRLLSGHALRSVLLLVAAATPNRQL
jgi:hypothetical protein